MARRKGGLVPRRYICAVLDDMRKSDKAKNYGNMEALIEEAQMYGDRMESGLEAAADVFAKVYRVLEDDDREEDVAPTLPRVKLDRVRKLIKKSYDPQNLSVERYW